jgi:AcrR family transcriptional regulator
MKKLLKVESLTDQEMLILTIAREEFEKVGFHATNVESIASRVGIGKGTIYRHFGNKADLFYYTLLLSMYENLNRITNLLNRIEDPYQALDSLFDEVVQRIILEDVLNNSLIWQSMFIDDCSDELSLYCTQITDKIITEVSVLISQILESTGKNTVDAKVIADYIFSSLGSFIYMRMRYHNESRDLVISKLSNIKIIIFRGLGITEDIILKYCK